ncbi:MAG TPA: methylated-DNA--[protein]-cysteine S-methyltransferase [Candidatus Cybelea sp.]|jgi:AraC family transcriptional regulator of adaptative response/methylated-DNA-[protein]-cysteine methyltransferase|nr:methylated-DNA--[protein]-cysteine S-methyltransferase [Candidatus Cybelea sp.]
MNEVERIREVCRYVEGRSDETLSLDALAKRAKMSKYHFARRFKEVVGVTAKQYAAAMRLRRLKGALKAERSIDDALYGAGYGSPSRVYEKAIGNLGMTPAQYRSAGEGISISYATLETPIGLMMIGATDRGVCFAQFGESAQELLGRLQAEYANAAIAPAGEPYHSDFPKWVDAISRYLAGAQPHLELPLDIRASAFQMRVWKYLQSIPYGDVVSYGEVAAGIGYPSAARAVGGAIARNCVALIIPCHRVIRESGAIGGYRWGFERKRALLDLERAHGRAGKSSRG